MPAVVYIGEKLKEIRTRRLLTQEELAEKAGVSHSTIVNVERNQAEPPQHSGHRRSPSK